MEWLLPSIFHSILPALKTHPAPELFDILEQNVNSVKTKATSGNYKFFASYFQRPEIHSSLMRKHSWGKEKHFCSRGHLQFWGALLGTPTSCCSLRALLIVGNTPYLHGCSHQLFLVAAWKLSPPKLKQITRLYLQRGRPALAITSQPACSTMRSGVLHVLLDWGRHCF